MQVVVRGIEMIVIENLLVVLIALNSHLINSTGLDTREGGLEAVVVPHMQVRLDIAGLLNFVWHLCGVDENVDARGGKLSQCASCRLGLRRQLVTQLIPVELVLVCRCGQASTQQERG